VSGEVAMNSERWLENILKLLGVLPAKVPVQRPRKSEREGGS